MSQHPKNKPLYMISVAAELTGMHPQTLRVYEQRGLVNPGRSRGNTRLYSQEDIERINLIAQLTEEGINLAGVVRILNLQERVDQKDAEIEDLQHQVHVLESQVCEYRTQRQIVALAPYEGKDPFEVMQKLLDISKNSNGDSQQATQE